MQSSMLRHITEDLGNGGTIDGDLTISGDLTVSGGGSLSFDEILEGTQVIDVTNAEAFLVRKNSDGGDIFTVNTDAETVTVTGGLTVTAESDSKAGFRLYTGSTLLGGIYNSSGKVHLQAEGDRDVSIGSSNNADRVVIDTSTGNVGIGDSTPDNTLSIFSPNIIIPISG